MFIVVKSKIIIFWLVAIAFAIYCSVMTYPKPIKANLEIADGKSTVVLDAGHSK
jgi:hypothetical protein